MVAWAACGECCRPRGLAGEIVAAGRAARVEDEGGRRLRGGGGGDGAKARLEAAMRKAEAEVRRTRRTRRR